MTALGRSDSEGTVIGAHVKLSGALVDPNDIVILGKVEGEVHSDHSVIIGPHAEVKGPVSGARVVVGGVVKGNIQSRDRVEILPRGSLTGDIETRDLVIHSGAFFNGRSRMIAPEKGGQTVPEQETHGEASEIKNSPQPTPRRVWPPIRLASLRQTLSEKKSTPTPSQKESSASPQEGAIEDKVNPAEKTPYEIE